MSNIQITAVLLALLIGLVIEFFFGRRMFRAMKRNMGTYFMEGTHAGGSMSGLGCMIASVPGILMLVALNRLLDVNYPDAMYLLIWAAYFIIAFVAIYGFGIRSKEDEDSRV